MDTPDSTPESNSPAQLFRTTLITLVATTGGFLFGFDSGVINGTVEGLKEAFASDSLATGFNVASMAGQSLLKRRTDRNRRKVVHLPRRIRQLPEKTGPTS